MYTLNIYDFYVNDVSVKLFKKKTHTEYGIKLPELRSWLGHSVTWAYFSYSSMSSGLMMTIKGTNARYVLRILLGNRHTK